MRKVIYQRYSTLGRVLKDESITIDCLDTSNDTKYFKKFQKGQITAEEVAKKNHEDGLHYEVTILEEETPIAFLEIVHENEFVGVKFLDEEGRDYLHYHFSEIEPKKKLFLEELWFYHFKEEDTSSNSDYRLHFVFDQEGNISYRKYDEINKKTIDYETKEPLDISGLYEDYPEFGHYDGLIKIERNMELLDNMDNI
jgi:hypothetical protein